MPKIDSRAPGVPDNTTLLEAYAFFFNHLLDFAATDYFAEFTPDYRREWLQEYRKFTEMVFHQNNHQ